MACTRKRSKLRAVSSLFFFYIGFLLFLSYRLKEENMFKDTVLHIILRNKLQHFSARHGSVSLELLKVREHR